MNNRKAFLILLLALCSLVPYAPISKADIYNPLLKISVKGVYLTAGTENTIEIELNNTGDFSVYDVEAVLSVPPSTLGIAVIEKGQMVFNEIENGKIETYNPIIYIDVNTPLGTYVLNLQVNYEERVGTVESHAVALQVGIIVNRLIKPPVRLNVEADAAHLRSGDENMVSITIENLGDEPVEEIDATLTTTSPYIAILRRNRFTTSALGRSGKVKYNVTIAVSRGAPIGVYTITASLSYKDSKGKTYSGAYTLGLNVDSVKIDKQTTLVLRRSEAQPVTVRPGGTVDLNLELACTGASAYDVKTLISLDAASSLSPISPTLVAIGDLNPDRTAMTRYRLLVDGKAKAGSYPVKITINYIDNYGVSKSLSETTIVNVSSLVEFSLLNMKELIAQKGLTATLEADLLLIGTESIKFVQIDALGGSPIRQTSKSNSYIGVVDPDSPTPFDVQFLVEPDAKPGDYVLRLNVTYYDNLNQLNASVIKVPFSVVEAPASQEQAGPVEGFWLWLRRLLGLMP